jgi:hypothetical protein
VKAGCRLKSTLFDLGRSERNMLLRASTSTARAMLLVLLLLMALSLMTLSHVAAAQCLNPTPVGTFGAATNDDVIREFSYDGGEGASFSAHRAGDHSYRVNHSRIQFGKKCPANITTDPKGSCGCHFEPDLHQCVASFEQSHHPNCSQHVPWAAEAFVYHPTHGTPGFTPMQSGLWDGQCCLIRENTVRWPTTQPSPRHVSGFVATDNWKKQVSMLNGQPMEVVASSANGAEYNSLQNILCGNNNNGHITSSTSTSSDQPTACVFQREPGNSYGSHYGGHLRIGGNSDFFPLTATEHECARLCCLLGSACTIYTWFAPRHSYGGGLAHRCVYAGAGSCGGGGSCPCGGGGGWWWRWRWWWWWWWRRRWWWWWWWWWW